MLEPCDEFLKPAAILDIGVVALLPIDRRGVGGMEDGGDVGFDGDPAVVAAGEGIGEDLARRARDRVDVAGKVIKPWIA